MRMAVAYLFFALTLVAADTVTAAQLLGTYDAWEAYTDRESGKRVCYMGSEPTKARGKYEKRGQTFILVTHRPAEKSNNVVSVEAGYTYKNGSEVEITVGKSAFKLFTQAGHAFTYDSKSDDELVKAMIRGAAMTVKGRSSRGTLTTDTYSLKGFTAAYKAISRACKI